MDTPALAPSLADLTLGDLRQQLEAAHRELACADIGISNFQRREAVMMDWRRRIAAIEGEIAKREDA